MRIPFKKQFLILGMYVVLWFLMIPNLVTLSAAKGPQEVLTSQTIRQGVFLVASPSLLDPNFREAVVLICNHEAGGILGIIVNRPTKLSLSEVFPTISGLKTLPHTLFEGGPVQQGVLLMLFLSNTGSDHTKQVMDGVYWGGDLDKLTSMVAQSKPKERFRVFAGYSGWSLRQLKAEIANGFWTTVPADKKAIFDSDPRTLWEKLVDKSTDPHNFVSVPTDLAS